MSKDTMGIIVDPTSWESVRLQWVQLLEQMDGSPYTVYSNIPDVAVDPSVANSWFTNALTHLRSIEGMDRGTYFRYAPFHDVDKLPTEVCGHVLALGRFLYEYLFPVGLSSEP